MTEQNYYNKFIILFLFTFANLFLIWYFMIREESADWISGQIVHQVSPYVVTEDARGYLVNNAMMSYEFRLPRGFKTVGARNFSFFLEADGQKKCEIEHRYLNAAKAKDLSSDDKKAVVSMANLKLVFEPVGTEAEKSLCAKYLKQIEASLLAN